jgi:enoyl-CoA hydratase
MSSFTTLNFDVNTSQRIATITLNRPERLNAINAHMPGEIRRAVEIANADDSVHVIILQGAGRAFCAGYDLKEFAESSTQRATQVRCAQIAIATDRGLPVDAMGPND